MGIDIVTSWVGEGVGGRDEVASRVLGRGEAVRLILAPYFSAGACWNRVVEKLSGWEDNL